MDDSLKVVNKTYRTTPERAVRIGHWLMDRGESFQQYVESCLYRDMKGSEWEIPKLPSSSQVVKKASSISVTPPTPKPINESPAPLNDVKTASSESVIQSPPDQLVPENIKIVAEGTLDTSDEPDTVSRTLYDGDRKVESHTHAVPKPERLKKTKAAVKMGQDRTKVIPEDRFSDEDFDSEEVQHDKP